MNNVAYGLVMQELERGRQRACGVLPPCKARW